MDVDTATVSSLQLTISALLPGDEYVRPSPPGLAMTETFNGSARIITYSGTRPTAFYLNLLTSFQFFNDLSEPDTSRREVTFQVFTPSDVGTELASNVAVTTIEVLPVNDNPPEFTAPSLNGSVFENQPAGTFTGVVAMATDMDVGIDTVISYFIEGDNPNFAIDMATGRVTTLRPLDADSAPLHTFDVVAMDTGPPESLNASVTVTIAVLDLNDNAPVFALPAYAASLAEDTSPGSPVLTVFAQDLDVSPDNSELIYELRGLSENLLPEGSGLLPFGSGVEPVEVFSIDRLSGEITTNAVLDFESVQEYRFSAVAFDTGEPSLTGTAEVVVTVQDSNDNRPQFENTPYFISVVENTDLQSEVFTVSASDADSGTNGDIEYSVLATNLFSIDPASGILILVQPLDFESVQSVSFSVMATDLGFPRLSFETDVLVSVSNVNDNPPVFEQASYDFTVVEGAALVVQVIATDADGSLVLYSLRDDSEILFDIDTISGEITSRFGFVFDFETRTEYSFVAAAEDDDFTTLANVTVRVLDTNDEPPVFFSDATFEAISEGTTPGVMVAQVFASDADSGSNAEIVFSIINGNSDGTFRIDPSSGAIFLIRALDFEMLPNIYTLTVQASNPAPPNLNANATVVIEVVDINDLAPVVTLDQTNLTYRENSGPLLIAQGISITDLDGRDHPLTQCGVLFQRGLCGAESSYCEERVSVNGSLAAQLGLSVEELDLEGDGSLFISGNFSESAYETVLSTLAYEDLTPEPIPIPRSISIQCMDRDFFSNILTITVAIELVNEFCPVIEATNSTFTYSEEMGELLLGQAAGITLSDEDSAPHDTLTHTTIVLSNVLDSGYEFIFLAEDLGFSVSATEESITIQGVAEISSYEEVLELLVYVNNRSEPTVGSRNVTVSLFDQSLLCASLELIVDVRALNDNPPRITLTQTFLQYSEESGELFFASQAGLTLSDVDHNALFPLEAASVSLEGVLDPGLEVLGFNSTLLPVGVVTTEVSQSRLEFSGEASVMEYNDLLLTLSYSNMAEEPTPGNRTITLSAFDGNAEGSTIVIVLVILSNDNPIELTADATQFVFTEGDVSIPIPGVGLADIDADSVVEGLNVTLSGALENGREFLLLDQSSLSGSTGEDFVDGEEITLAITAPLSNYTVSDFMECNRHVFGCVFLAIELDRF